MGLGLRHLSKLLVAGWPREQHHITRHYMYNHLRGLVRHLDTGRHTLAISHSQELCRVLGVCPEGVTATTYPATDLLALEFPDETFDLIVADQVLEHVSGAPERAASESLRVLKPGGIGVHTTCLLNPVHSCPGDYWRFTADGLRLLFQDGSEIVDAGGWGTLSAWFFILAGLRMESIPRWRWHPLHLAASGNRAGWPIVTWVVFKKNRSIEIDLSQGGSPD